MHYPDTRFACQQNCGQCCKGSTELHVREIERLHDVLPLAMIAWRIDRGDMHHEQFKWMKPALFKKIGDYTTTWWMPKIVSHVSKNKMCPALDDGKRCTVYEQRPFACKLLPIDGNVPPILLGEGIGGLHDWMCPPEAKSEDKPWIIKGGKCVSQSHLTTHRLNNRGLIGQKRIMEVAFGMAWYYSMECGDGEILPDNQTGDVAHEDFLGNVSIGWLLVALAHLKEMTIEQCKDILAAQLSLHTHSGNPRFVESMTLMLQDFMDGSILEATRELFARTQRGGGAAIK